MTIPRRLLDLLDGRPGEAAWQETCRLLEQLDDADLRAVTPRVLRWPAGRRRMPDHWWTQWVAGNIRPYHALAGTRRLGRLDRVETGTVPVPATDDWAADDGTADNGTGQDTPGGGADGGAGDEAACFYHGASTVAVPTGLRWLVLGAGAEWHHGGGDIVRWDTTRDAPLIWYLRGEDCHDEAYDLEISPDGSTVVTAVEGSWQAWSARTGERLWQLGLRSDDGGDGAPSGLPGLPDDPGASAAAGVKEGCHSMDDLVRFGFSADGRRLAVGTGSSDVVAVVEARTGAVLLCVPEGEDAFGPVALDAAGRLLAHAGPAGRVVVRAVDTGAVLFTAHTGLTSVGAVALAPDGTGLFVVGGVVGGAPEAAGLATHARPAARLFTLRGGSGGSSGRLTAVPGDLLMPDCFTEGLDADSPFAAVSSRAVWTASGPLGFVGADFGSLLFNGRGQTLWADPAGALAAFTPDGRAMVVVQEEIDAWFLDGLALPAGHAPPPAEPVPGEVLLSGLPSGLARRPGPGPRGRQAAQDEGVPSPGAVSGPGPASGAEPDAAEPQLPCSHWPVRLAAISDDARALAFCATLDRDSAERSQVLCRWPGKGGPPEVSLLPAVPGGAGYLTALAFGPHGDVVARCLLGEGSCLVLDGVADGETRWRHPLPPTPAHAEVRPRIGFSADGSRIALACHASGRVVVLDVATGKTVRDITEPAASTEYWPRLRVDTVALDRSGARVAFGARDDLTRVLVRDVSTGALLLEAEPEGLRQVTGLAFSPDGDTLAVAGATQHRHAGLWTLPLTGGLRVAPPARIAVRDLPMHDQPDGALAWSVTGPRAYFPGSNGTGAVWDAATGAVLADLPFGSADGGVALSPDGRTLVTVTQFGARRWPLPVPADG